jgi:hypothetical protein
MRARVQALRNRDGSAITLETRQVEGLWDQLHSAFVEVNSEDTEIFDDKLKQLTTMVPARVMLAQPTGALSDLNRDGRKPMVQIEEESLCDKLETETAALRNQVGQMIVSAELHTKNHQEQWNRGRSRENSRNSEHTGSPPRKKVTVPDRAS